jgi:protein-S-isoprenylcysteine O-methyltransferase Ste14
MILARYYIPFLNVAFLFSLTVTIVLTLAIIPFAKRRPAGKKLSWGEAMAGSAYVYFVLFMAYGVVPHQFLTHAGNELSWRSDKLLLGPAGVLKPKSLGGFFPFQVSYAAIQDIIATVIYIVFLGLQIWLWVWWQNRNKPKAAKAIATSSFGRPLVKKA